MKYLILIIAFLFLFSNCSNPVDSLQQKIAGRWLINGNISIIQTGNNWLTMDAINYTGFYSNQNYFEGHHDTIFNGDTITTTITVSLFSDDEIHITTHYPGGYDYYVGKRVKS